MLQELFRIPGLDLPVFGYGLMLVIGVFAAIQLGSVLANRNGLNGDDFWNIGFLALVGGVFGARLSHVLENLDVYTDSSRSFWANLKAAVNLSNGGLTFYGGFIFATIVLISYAKWKRIPLRLGMDIVAPCLMIGLAFGRVGCLLNGCCWGDTCSPDRVPWAVTFPYASPPYSGQFADGKLHIGDGHNEVPRALVTEVETESGDERLALLPQETVAKDETLRALARSSRSLPVHPTQVYSTLNAFLIAAICIVFLRLRPPEGRVFALMLMLYGPGRFSLELLRVEPAVAGGMSFSMWVSIFTTLAGAVLWFAFGRRVDLTRSPRPAETPQLATGR